MFEWLLSVVGAVPPTLPPPSVPTTSTPGSSLERRADTAGDVVSTMIENLADNGYQTGTALVVATIAVVAMLNLKVHRLVMVPVGVGTFWAGWLGWNTITGEDNPLFPGDVSATKLWDVAFASDSGFLLAVGVACIAAVFLWRRGATLLNRVVMIGGAVLGASFVYNLVEAIRASSV